MMGDEKKTNRGATVAGLAVTALLTACGGAQAADDTAPLAESEAADEVPADEVPADEVPADEVPADEAEEPEDLPYNAGDGRG